MISALDIARQHIGQRETRGRNRSPFIDGITKDIIGGPLGVAWCAIFVCWCMLKARLQGAKGKPFPKSAGTQWLKAWARQEGIYSEDANDLKKWKGAMFGWTNADGKHGHIGFVAGRLTNDADGDGDLDVTAILTVEGNSNKAGSRDGDGVVDNRRSVPVDAKHKLWFINISEYAGGNFGWQELP